MTHVARLVGVLACIAAMALSACSSADDGARSGADTAAASGTMTTADNQSGVTTTTDSAVEPADEPADDVADEPADDTAGKPAEEQTDEPVDEPADEPSDQAAEEPSNEAPDEYCALAMKLNDIDVDDENPDPAEVKKFTQVAGQLAAAAPSEIRGPAKIYFSGLADLAQKGIPADLETIPPDMQEAFATVVEFTLQHCGSGQ